MFNNPNPKLTSGFTLLELVVAVSITGILMGLAIPSLTNVIRNNRLTSYSNELVTSFNLARSEAVKRGISISVRKISPGDTLPANFPTCTATGTVYWSTCGWRVFVDNNNSGTFDTGDVDIRAYPALPKNFTLAGINNFVNFIRYKPDGSSNTFGSFVVCDNSDGNNLPEAYTSRLIIIRQQGRIRMGKDSNGDGIPEDDSQTAITSCI